ncbi:hypothetical protein BDQ17DRAFT_146122 [Cyathus striatus]|nr:hypothetical protein BDQ17DRAFT_146122 [Cyathus striatus]
MQCAPPPGPFLPPTSPRLVFLYAGTAPDFWLPQLLYLLPFLLYFQTMDIQISERKTLNSHGSMVRHTMRFLLHPYAGRPGSTVVTLELHRHMVCLRFICYSSFRSCLIKPRSTVYFIGTTFLGLAKPISRNHFVLPESPTVGETHRWKDFMKPFKSSTNLLDSRIIRNMQ